MKPLRVLHVASFTGNIGDNANHLGLRRLLEENLGCAIDYSEFEMREVYWGQRRFDADFARLANQHDLVMFGGGNYFELWVEHSATGTSIDISREVLDAITTPVVFNALGVDPGQGASDQALTRFRLFLDYVMAREGWLLSCRNDGSMQTLRSLVGERYAEAFFHLPDYGFFRPHEHHFHAELNPDARNAVVQLAGDMPEVRFADRSAGRLDLSGFISEITVTIEGLSAAGFHVILVPHIFSDLHLIDRVMQHLPDPLRRRCMSVAPYVTGFPGARYIFSLYRQADLVLGMRFHANVCAYAFDRPCIGLSSYRQIDELYRELQLDERLIDVRKMGFASRVIDLAVRLIENPSIAGRSRLLSRYQQQVESFHQRIEAHIS